MVEEPDETQAVHSILLLLLFPPNHTPKPKKHTISLLVHKLSGAGAGEGGKEGERGKGGKGRRDT